MFVSTFLPIALGATTALAAPASEPQLSQRSMPLPSRYNGTTNAVFIDSVENGGIVPGPNGPDQYATVPIQAQDGKLVFTQQDPSRICPCSTSFGAQNFTGYYVGGTNAAPTLQLFTSGPEQAIYVDRDLGIKYTYPGAPVPYGANGTSIFFFQPEPLGGGLPSNSQASVQGHVLSSNGTKTYYNGIQFCAPKNSPARTEDGVGPLSISATRTQGNVDGGKAIIDDRCIEGFFSSSINDPKVAPYDIDFMTPSEPLAFSYKN